MLLLVRCCCPQNAVHARILQSITCASFAQTGTCRISGACTAAPTLPRSGPPRVSLMHGVQQCLAHHCSALDGMAE